MFQMGRARFGPQDGRGEHDPTPREMEVWRLWAMGFSIQGTAENLGIGRSTVMAHRHNLVGKLGLHHKSGLTSRMTRLWIENHGTK